MLAIPNCDKKWIWSLIFIRIPKNASTSIFNHLGDFNLIKKHEKSFNGLLNKKLYRKAFSPTHAKPDEIYQVFGNMVHNYASFAVVRNPYDRMVSMFHFSKKEKLGDLYGIDSNVSFERFCEILLDKYEQKDRHFIAIHQQCEWLEGAFKPNFILKFENLQNDFSDMLTECNIHHISRQLPKENSTVRGHYREYFNDRCKKITAKIFEKDVDTFKYLY